MIFELTILGSNSATPSFGRHQTAQLLNINEKFYLIDCGEGTQVRLKYYKKKFSRISHIFISHLHGDHYFGLPGLLSTMHLQGRTEELHLFAPAGLKEILLILLKHSATTLNYPLHFHETNPEKPEQIFENKHIIVNSIPLQHGIPCTGFYFKEKPKTRKIIKEKLTDEFTLQEIIDLKHGKDVEINGKILRNEDFTIKKRQRSFAFCSDTSYQEGIIDQIRDVSLLYHETTFMKNYAEKALRTGHSTTHQAAQIAQKANAERLIIGHYSSRYREIQPLLQEAREIFPVTELAIEGKSFSVSEIEPS